MGLGEIGITPSKKDHVISITLLKRCGCKKLRKVLKALYFIEMLTLCF